MKLLLVVLFVVVLFVLWRRARARADARLASLPTLMLLQSEPPNVDEDALRAKLSERFHRPFGATPASKDVVARFAPDRLGIMVAGLRVNVMTSGEPLPSLKENAESMPELRRKMALQNHRGWISIFLADGQDCAEDDAWRAIGRIAAEMADDGTLALLKTTTGGLVPWSDDVREALRRGDGGLGASVAPAPMAAAKPDDERLVEARAEARERWPEFVARFADRKSNETFAVKGRFTQADDVEFMWVIVESIEGDVVRGRLDNDPAMVTRLRSGQTVEVPRVDVDDWVIQTPGGLEGGFSIAVLSKAVQGKG